VNGTALEIATNSAQVIAEVDRGTPILQVEVPLRHGESLDELTERIHGVEHDAIVEGAIEAIKKIRSIRA
jgi:phosphoribosylglycinamide formyltransferase